MTMNSTKSILESITETNAQIEETARDVNESSQIRKQITTESLLLISELMDKNEQIINDYAAVYENLNKYISSIEKNLSFFTNNVQLFQEIMTNTDQINELLINVSSNINSLVEIENKIKKETDEISIQATNASIVSSKYQEISSVFEILSNKLNDMSEFIGQNLEKIINYINPINTGIDSLLDINLQVNKDIDNGHRFFTDFLEKLRTQERTANEQIQKAKLSGRKIEEQKKRIQEINKQVIQMDADAGGAIEGSGNVMKISNSINRAAESLFADTINRTDNFTNTLTLITEKAVTIWQTAQKVNEKSRSQLEFSYSSLEFCRSMIKESKELEKTVGVFNKHSADNNELALRIRTSLNDLLNRFNEIENTIADSETRLKTFTDDYFKINNIIDILKKILKQMKIIGIYSKIESSRDPVAFDGYMTISKNIQKQQNNIRDYLPAIEKNIRDTKIFINEVNDIYKNITGVFTEIRDRSLSITNDLNEISETSIKIKTLSESIMNESLNLDTLLNDLENYLNKLIEVVEKPIEGSAQNIERGKFIEKKTNELEKMIL